VRKPGSSVVTTEFRGVFTDDAAARAEVLSLARG
jgi:GTP cyclohydrolase I